MTELETGIIVLISDDQYELLKNKPGFLHYDNYPDQYKKIAKKDELGRFLFFRFLRTKIIK